MTGLLHLPQPLATHVKGNRQHHAAPVQESTLHFPKRFHRTATDALDEPNLTETGVIVAALSACKGRSILWVTYRDDKQKPIPLVLERE